MDVRRLPADLADVLARLSGGLTGAAIHLADEPEVQHVGERAHHLAPDLALPLEQSGDIVQRVAEEHDGSARAWNAADGGAVVSLELPTIDGDIPV